MGCCVSNNLENISPKTYSDESDTDSITNVGELNNLIKTVNPNKTNQCNNTSLDRYDRELLLCGYLRSMIYNDNIIIPLQIETIITQYYYTFSLKFSINQQIDYKDSDGYWFLATIKLLKHPHKQKINIINSLYLTAYQKSQIDKYNKLEALLISYKQYENDKESDYIKKWIFIEKDSICECECDGECQKQNNEKHYINSANINVKKSKPKPKPKPVEFRYTQQIDILNHTAMNHSNNNVDWNGPAFQRLEKRMQNMKQPDWNSPAFQRLEKRMQNMKQTDWNSPQFQRLEARMNNTNLHSSHSGMSSGFGTSSFGRSSGFGW